MKAVVLGGGGLTGQCTVRDLATGGVFDSVVAADVDPELAKAAAKAAGSRATPATIDVRNKTAVVNLLKGADVVVNAVQYNFNLMVMEATLEAHVPYLDFGGLFHMTKKQLLLDEKFRKAKLLAIPGLGEVPGISNVLAMQACEDLDRVESLIIRDGWKDLTVNGPEISFTWSPSTFLDEMVLPAQVFEDGAYREYPAMSSAEEYEFGPPIGKTRVYRTLHSEPATLPDSLRSKGIRHCEWKEGGPGIEVLRTMALLGLASDVALDVRGQKVSPREFTLALLKRGKLLGNPEGVTINDWEIFDIEVKGTKGGKPVVRHARGLCPPRTEWRLTATEYSVGIAGAVGAELIVQGKVPGAGVLPPERCVPAAPYRAGLAKRGLETRIDPPEGPLPTRKSY
jgi:saccharopine dehydrogenase-like NADP-dependent oxidoreductase